MTLPWLNESRAKLRAALETSRFGHAPLIHGPRGTGKRQLADWLVACLLCRDPDAARRPCGECRSCRLLETGAHPDRFEMTVLEGKTEILVDQVRELSRNLELTPSVSAGRVGLIRPAERLNLAAANALLKTLEEPSAGAWLVLVSDQPEGLPATVRSRCQRIRVPLPDPETAADWLAGKFPERDEASRRLALRMAGGAPRVAAGWLGGQGLEQGLELGRHLAAVLAGESRPAPVAEWAADPQVTWDWLGRWCCELVRGALTGERIELPGVDRGPRLDRRALAGLQECWALALEGRRLANTPVRHDLLLHKWLIQFGSMRADVQS